MKKTNPNMTKSADVYFLDGCGRCKYMASPQCKVRTWEKELDQLRRIVLDCGLNEESKWGMPVYTTQNKNIVMVSAFKEYCVMSFFKGTFLSDFENILTKPGEQSQTFRYAKFTNVERILELETTLKAYIFEAIEIEKAGLKVAPRKTEDMEMPEELLEKFEELPDFKKAFFALTPGRQRAYLLYFASAKQAKTRIERILKYMPVIFNGKGMND